MKMYLKNGYKIRKFDKNEIKVLTELKPENLFVSEKTINYIIEKFDLNSLNEEELQATRNGVVIFYSELSRDISGNGIKMSMVVAIIDNMKFQKGYEI